MKNIIQNKTFVILLALTGLIALGALASGIRGMEFREPDPFYFEWPTSSGSTFQTVIQQMESLPLEQVILFWAMIIIFTVLIIFLISPKYRWKILMAVIRTAIIFIILVWGLKFIAQNVTKSLGNSSALAQNAKLNFDSSKLPSYSLPMDNPLLSYVISLTITLGILFLGWWLWNIGTRPRSGTIRKDIAEIARRTLDEIADGRDFGDTVTTCYVRMNDAVDVRRGLMRQDDMTPTEFAARLESAGLPGGPVRRLTRLFEAVRYGARKPGESETREAVTCLNEIIAACGAES